MGSQTVPEWLGARRRPLGTYLGRRIEVILAEIDMTLDDFTAICDRFTNKQLFVRDNTGNLVRDPPGSLIKINDDNS